MVRVTSARRKLLAGVGVCLSSLALCAGVLEGAVDPEEASAIGTVAAATVAALGLLVRRSPGGAPPSEESGATMSLEK